MVSWRRDGAAKAGAQAAYHLWFLQFKIIMGPMTEQVRSSGAGRTAGRGRGLRGRCGRAGGRGDRGTPRIFSKKTRFEGKYENLKGFVYDFQSSRQANRYIKNTEAISEYVDT